MKKIMVLMLLFGSILFAQIDRGWDELAGGNRYEAARALFDQTEGDLARIGWFLTFTGNGPNQEMTHAALEVLRRSPESPAAEFVMRWMQPLQECPAEWMAAAAALIVDRQPENPELMVLYADHLRSYSRYQRDAPDFREIADESGFLTHWRFSKRFGAYPIPAFERSWPPERTEYWTESVDHQSRTGVIIPPRESRGAGVLFAFSAFENPVSQVVSFRIFSYQNIAVFVDGKRFGQFAHMEGSGPNIRYLQAKLSAGRHEIMVKVSQTRANNGQFSLQVSAPKMPHFPEPGLPSKALAGAFPGVKTPNMGLARLIENDESNLALLLRAYLALSNKDSETALAILQPLHERYPKSQLVGGLLAGIYLELVPFLPRDEQVGQAFRILSGLAQEGAGHDLENRMALAKLLQSAKQTPNALALLNQTLEANPAYCEALEARLNLAGGEALLDVREETLALVKKLGDDHRWALKLLLEQAREEGNLERTGLILDRLGELLPWQGYTAQREMMNQNYRAAIEDLTRQYEMFQNIDYYPYAIAEAYAKLGDHDRQREWLEQTLVSNPGNRKAILDLVNLDCLSGNRELAMQRLRDYLKEEPSDAAFRQRLSHLEGRTAFESFRVDSDKVIEQAKNKPISRGADAELLLDQLMVRLFPDGSQMRYTRLITRVLTKDGVDSESERQLPEDLEILELRTIKQDGRVFYPASFDSKDTISLSGVGIGDFIDEEHIEYLPPAYYDEDGLDANMTFIFQGVDRIYHHSELVLIYPENLSPEPVLLSRNMPSEPEIEVEDGLKYVRWLTRDMPPLKVEDGMPPAGYFQPTASFYYNTNHEEIRDFYINAVRTRMGLSARLKQKVEQWRESQSDPRELAEEIYREVVDRIEPASQFYRNINLVWETKTGNATLLLAAIYRALGIDVDIVLTRAAQLEDFVFDTPLPGYSYVLLRVRFGKKDVWIDANHPKLAFGYIPFQYRDAEGLVLNPDRPLKTTTPKLEDKTERVETVYTLDFDPLGGVTGKGSEKFHGLFATQLADRYANLNTPETKQRVEAGVNQSFRGAVVTQVDVQKDQPRGEFELTHRFRLPELGAHDDQGFQIPFPLPHPSMLDRYGKLATRVMPISIAQPVYNVARLEINLPKGFHWTTEDETIWKETPFGSYLLEIKRTSATNLLLERTYRLPAQLVDPGDYQEFLVFCRAMVENEDMILAAEKDVGQP